jgi:hypothetical protein
MASKEEFIIDLMLKLLWKSHESGSCRVWNGATANGYGRQRAVLPGGKVQTFGAHRCAYIIKSGSITIPTQQGKQNLEVSHLCHNKLCINQEHLVLETQAVNASRNRCALLKHCTQRHSPRCVFEML